MGRVPWQSLAAHIYQTTDAVDLYTIALEIHLPAGPEIWDGPDLGTMVFTGGTLSEVLENTVKAFYLLDYRGDITLYDATERTYYGAIDFQDDKPRARCEYDLIRKDFGEDALLSSATNRTKESY